MQKNVRVIPEVKVALKYDSVYLLKKQLKGNEMTQETLDLISCYVVKYRKRRVLKFLLENKRMSYNCTEKMLCIAIEILDTKAVKLILLQRDFERDFLNYALDMAFETGVEHIYDLVYEKLYRV